MRSDQRPRPGRSREPRQRDRPRLSRDVRGANRSLAATAGWSQVPASYRTSWTSHPLIRSEVIRGSPSRAARRNTAPRPRTDHDDPCPPVATPGSAKTAPSRRPIRTIPFVLQPDPGRATPWRHSMSCPGATSTPPGRSFSDQRGRAAGRCDAAEIVRRPQREPNASDNAALATWRGGGAADALVRVRGDDRRERWACWGGPAIWRPVRGVSGWSRVCVGLRSSWRGGRGYLRSVCRVRRCR